MGVRKFFNLVFLLAVVLPAHADDFSASNSLVRLEQISESVHALEKAAARGSVRANCLTDRLIKIDSLVIVVRGMVDVRAEHLAAGNNTAAEGDQLMIQTAITRAEKTAAEAENCPSENQAPTTKTASTNFIVAPASVISNSLARFEQLSATVQALAQTVSNGSVRADCITDSLIKIDSLATVARGLADSHVEHLAAGNMAAAEGDQVMIQKAYARAEKAALEATDCQGDGQSKKHKATLANTQSASSSPSKPVEVTPVIPIGDETTCVKQLKLAALLAQAMGLEIVTNTPIQALTKEAIEPLAGWHAEACVTLDTFCVLIARALKFKVDAPAEPTSYLRAVRDGGLPVEPLLSHRILFEHEVRLFLSQGYAAPLPSSRRLLPD